MEKKKIKIRAGWFNLESVPSGNNVLGANMLLQYSANQERSEKAILV